MTRRKKLDYYPETTCAHCGDLFHRTRPWRRFCTIRCLRRAYRVAKEIEVTPAMIEAGSRVLLAEDSLGIGQCHSEILTRRVIVAALGVIGGKSFKEAKND